MSRKRYEAVIFDWDGTVMDSSHAIATAIRMASLDLGLPAPSMSMASWVIGLSLESALYRAVPDLNAEQMPLFLERYRHHFSQRDPEIKLFDGVLELMNELKAEQIVLSVATGKSRVGLNRALSNLCLIDYFDATRCADETKGKPHPLMLHEIMDELSLSPERVLMVGDTTHDIVMASSAGMDSLAVSYGAHDPKTLSSANPTYMADSVSAMRDAVLRLI